MSTLRAKHFLTLSCIFSCRIFKISYLNINSTLRMLVHNDYEFCTHLQFEKLWTLLNIALLCTLVSVWVLQ